jgi:tetratricopeptide (TPR) repeat protein
MQDLSGDLIRRIRKGKGVKLTELVDENLSISTLSRIENEQPVDDGKIKLLLDKLSITDEDIKKSIEEMNQEESIKQFVSQAVETQIRQGVLSLQEFNDKIKLIRLPGLASYLKGKRYLLKSNYQKAIKHYEDCIHSSEEDYCQLSNVKSSSLLDLSVIAYKKNNFSQALEYLDQGLKMFNLQGSRQHARYSIMYNQALIYEQLGQLDRADGAIALPWRYRMYIDDMRTRIQVYQLKASIIRQRKHYDKAAEILSQALDLANINDISDGAYYVLVDLGKLAIEMQLFDYAERCFETALLLKKELKVAKTITAHMELSKLYSLQGDRKHKAKQHIQQAIKIAKRSRDMNKLIQAYIVSADIYEKENNQKEACLFYKKALELADMHNFEQYKPELYDHIFRCNN